MPRPLPQESHSSSFGKAGIGVPEKVAKPVESGGQAPQALQVFGSGDTLVNEDKDEAGRDKGHGEDHADGDKHVHRGGHPGSEGA